mmetsp:Transcript_12652/g.29715  ORF Transcript_12652/g.29715 Transcript_12652/m.29715 type:complete len:204 (+) Transcript_12652:244-855(+)
MDKRRQTYGLTGISAQPRSRVNPCGHSSGNEVEQQSLVWPQGLLCASFVCRVARAAIGKETTIPVLHIRKPMVVGTHEDTPFTGHTARVKRTRRVEHQRRKRLLTELHGARLESCFCEFKDALTLVCKALWATERPQQQLRNLDLARKLLRGEQLVHSQRPKVRGRNGLHAQPAYSVGREMEVRTPVRECTHDETSPMLHPHS